jgi:hypothetical protein
MNVIVLQHKTGTMKFTQIQIESRMLIGVNILYMRDNMNAVQVEHEAWYFSST